MTTVLVVAYAHVFESTINKMVAEHPGMPWHRARGPNWAKIGDTKYQLVSHPNRMKGIHNAKVEFWGPLPFPELHRQWQDEAATEAAIASTR